MMTYIIVNPDHPIGDKPRDQLKYHSHREAFEEAAIAVFSDGLNVDWIVLEAGSERGVRALRNCEG